MSELTVVPFRPLPEQYAWTCGGAAPVMRIRSGTVLEVWTQDCFAGRVRSTEDLVSVVCEFPFLNPQTGPFYVEGAEPGDSLAVHFVSIEPSRDWAASSTVPLFGALTGTHLTATLQDPLPERVWIWQVDRTSRTCRFSALDSDFQVDLPLDPMHGTVGVAPANLEVLSALTPAAHGGNMDTPEMRAGATCYLGVNVEGALFSLGDGHARQGEGETCGVAVECSGPDRAACARGPRGRRHPAAVAGADVTEMSYVPGPHVALVGEGCTLLLLGDAAPDQISRLWPLVRDAADLDLLLEALSVDGLRAMGPCCGGRSRGDRSREGPPSAAPVSQILARLVDGATASAQAACRPRPEVLRAQAVCAGHRDRRADPGGAQISATTSAIESSTRPGR